MFDFFMNIFLELLSAVDAGIASCFTDVMLMAKTGSGLQRMLNQCSGCCGIPRMSWNVTKSAVLMTDGAFNLASESLSKAALLP